MLFLAGGAPGVGVGLRAGGGEVFVVGDVEGGGVRVLVLIVGGEEAEEVVRGVCAFGLVHHPAAACFQRLFVEGADCLPRWLRCEAAGEQEGGEGEEGFMEGSHLLDGGVFDLMDEAVLVFFKRAALG